MSYENSIENREQIITMIKSLSDYFTTIRDELCEPYGLSSIQAVIILDIYHHPGETRVTDICKRLHKSTNTISPLINRLVQKGYLKKKVSSEDARVTNIYLTDKTKEMATNILVDVSDYTWPFFESLSQEQFDQIYDALKLLLEVTGE
jgi:DNA-binding MarR family transcriptional regulator